MRIPFRRKPARRRFTVTFAVAVNLSDIGEGRVWWSDGLATLAFTCTCGQGMNPTGLVARTANSVTARCTCPGCGGELDVVYLATVEQSAVA
jgi:hypothetical protein